MEEGFAIAPGVLTSMECEELIAALPSSQKRSANLRNLLQRVPHVAILARSERMMRLVKPWLGEGAMPVRALLFDKTHDANWGVAWHQDLAIAVKRKVDLPGFTGWSVKSGVVHVHPLTPILEQMLTVRLHLDDCDETNGALRVLPHSHLEGKLDASQVDRWVSDVQPVTCAIGRGGAVLLRPLLLHASSPSPSPRHRRVVHIEYGSQPLPGGLEWAEAARP